MRPFLQLSALAVAIVTLTVVGGRATASEAPKAAASVRVSLGPYYDYQMYTVADQLGIDRQFDIDLQLKGYAQWDVARLKRGSIDLLDSCQVCATITWSKFPEYRDILITNHFRGFVLVGRTGSETYAQVVNRVGSKKKAIRIFVQSLRGKRFAMWKQASLSTLVGLLRQGGLSAKDVKILDFVDDNKAALAFLRGVGDYYIGALPQVARMLFSPEFKGKYVKAAPFEAFGPSGLWFSTYATTEGYLAKNHETVLRLSAVWYRATRYLHQKPDVALPIISKAMAVSAGGVFDDKLTKKILTDLNYFPTIQKAQKYYFDPKSATNNEKAIAALIQIQKSEGQVPKDLNWRRFEVAGPLLREVLNRKDLMTQINAPLR